MINNRFGGILSYVNYFQGNNLILNPSSIDPAVVFDPKLKLEWSKAFKAYAHLIKKERGALGDIFPVQVSVDPKIQLIHMVVSDSNRNSGPVVDVQAFKACLHKVIKLADTHNAQIHLTWSDHFRNDNEIYGAVASILSHDSSDLTESQDNASFDVCIYQTLRRRSRTHYQELK